MQRMKTMNSWESFCSCRANNTIDSVRPRLPELFTGQNRLRQLLLSFSVALTPSACLQLTSTGLDWNLSWPLLQESSRSLWVYLYICVCGASLMSVNSSRTHTCSSLPLGWQGVFSIHLPAFGQRCVLLGPAGLGTADLTYDCLWLFSGITSQSSRRATVPSAPCRSLLWIYSSTFLWWRTTSCASLVTPPVFHIKAASCSSHNREVKFLPVSSRGFESQMWHIQKLWMLN